MRRLLLGIAASVGVILQTGVATAAPVLHLSGWSASAGRPETFTITRIGGNGAATITFATHDGTATAPVDYAATTQTITWRNGQTSAIVQVPTVINPAKAGRVISFTGTITANGVTGTATGIIVEPAAPTPAPSPTPTPAPAPTPVTWTTCSGEWGACTVIGTANVRFGSGTQWTVRSVDTSIICSAAIFGGDPAPGQRKECDTDGKVGKQPNPNPEPRTPPVQEAAIPDNFDPTGGLVPASGLPIVEGDGTSAFRMFCTAGQLSRDDPLVKPGQPGASHLHQFFGNTGTNAFSTYQSLRTTGGTTCGDSKTPFNRSAVWFPAMLDGLGNAVKPDFIKYYYKGDSSHNAYCAPLGTTHPAVGDCTDLPNGLRYKFGYDLAAKAPGQGISFACYPSEDRTVGQGTATGVYKNIAEVVAAGCPVGAELVIAASAPSCWDGKSLDGNGDFSSQMAYATGLFFGGNELFPACPIDHPRPVPNSEWLIVWTVTPSFATWHVSSDEMVPGVPAGTTFHLDYWEAWSPSIKAMWHAGCIERILSCSNGALGDPANQMIKGADVPPGGFPTTGHLIPLSSIP